MRVLIVGGGNMGGCFVQGWRNQHELKVLEGDQERAKQVANKLEVEVGCDAKSLVEWAQVVVICLKPHIVRSFLEMHNFEHKLIISIAAGITREQLAGWSRSPRVIRVMPNTPCQVLQGMTVILQHPTDLPVDLTAAQSLFAAIGRTLLINNENQMNVITAVSGSGPAFLCLILEAMTDGAVQMGLPRDQALELACQTMRGTAQMIQDTKQHPAVLREAVTTPAGCTIAGLARMEEGAVRHWLAQAIKAATERLQ